MLVVLAVAGCKTGADATTQATPHGPRAPVATETLVITLTGAGLGEPKSFTYKELTGMEMTRMDDVLMRTSYAGDILTDWQGPAVDTLLDMAQVKPGPVHVTVEAVDGYKVQCQRDDLESAIVAVKDGEGRWLAARDNTCPVRLVAPSLPANFWVMTPTRFLVEPIADTTGSP